MADESDMATATSSPAPAAAAKPAELPGNLTAPGSAPDGSQDGEPEDWKPPQVDDNGFAIDGHGWPINLRLRALRLADAGEAEDPAGSVSPEAIAEAGDQLAAYDKQYPALASMKKDQLAKQAEDEKVELPEGATADDIRAALEAARPVRI